MEEIFKNYKKIKQNKRREAIENNLEKISISKKLVTLKSDIAIDIKEDKISNTSFNKKTLLSFFEKHGFNNLLGKINTSHRQIEKNIEKKY